MPVGERPPVVLPTSFWSAVARGLAGRCPRCGQTRLFRAFLKPVDRCGRCNQDWTPQRADDFPAYVSLFVTGHVMAPIAVYLAQETDHSIAAITAVVLPMALTLSLGLLQPSKGGIIAIQWWMGMHGFERERAAPAAADNAQPLRLGRDCLQPGSLSDMAE